MDDVGAEIDADAAVLAFDALVMQARATMAEAVAEAPIDSPEHARKHHGRSPGALKASARVLFLVNGFEHDEAEAREAIRSAALKRTLYSVNAEIRFERPYARHQHDRRPHGFKNGQWRHLQGGKAKYLEDPIKRASATLVPGMRDSVGRFRKHA